VRLGARFWIDYRYKDGLARLIANYDVAQFFSDLPKQATGHRTAPASLRLTTSYPGVSLAEKRASFDLASHLAPPFADPRRTAIGDTL
jgi:hypothetical protein